MPHPVKEIVDCRRDMADFAQMWRSVSGNSAPRARAEAETQVFNQMVVALNARFGLDALPRASQIVLEVRLLSEGVALGGWFLDPSPRWQADASVTGNQPGDRIELTEKVFAPLSGVFLDCVMQFADA